MAAGFLAGLLKKALINTFMDKMGVSSQGGGGSQGQEQQGIYGLYMNATGQDPFAMGLSGQEVADRLRKMSMIGNIN